MADRRNLIRTLGTVAARRDDFQHGRRVISWQSLLQSGKSTDARKVLRIIRCFDSLHPTTRTWLSARVRRDFFRKVLEWTRH
ncbi:MAG: hypothetical protein D6679_11535 [Candidatus Hydrogenedentota bacterium]|nr:MAG: hypothetical protein D6679_11535 [Candidatus Hydrogenedentota bacterium]